MRNVLVELVCHCQELRGIPQTLGRRESVAALIVRSRTPSILTCTQAVQVAIYVELVLVFWEYYVLVPNPKS